MDFFVREKRSKDDVDIFGGFMFEFFVTILVTFDLCNYVYLFATSTFELIFEIDS